MARIGSIAVGGYFPTPRHLIPRIAPILAAYTGEQEVSFMDPCAGEGEAILSLMKLLVKHEHPVLYAAEMEASRFETLTKVCRDQSWSLGNNLVHGDAFRVTFRLKDRDGVSVLYLNPPYDFNRQHGRLEQKFLHRFTPALMMGGALLFVVPHYALKASADFLATEYENIRCFKFPEPEYSAFKQVVLFAQRADSRLSPDPEILDQVTRYAAGVDGMPEELPNLMSRPVAEVRSSYKYHEGLDEWVIRSTDVSALLEKVRPWQQTGRSGAYQPVRGVLPELPLHELLFRKYPVATPPRPAHIAAGIASGIFNGSRVTPNHKIKLPALLVKGVFSHEYRTVEEKTSKDGSVTSYVQIQQPKLVATVLDLATHKYHTLGNDSNTEPDIKTLTVSGLLKHYGDSLMGVMEEQCPILYDPRRDAASIPLAETARKPFTAQGHAAKALISLLGGPGKTLRQRSGHGAILLGEIGAGKCLKIGTKVIKFDGSIVPVEDVKTGDLLMGPDSLPKRVLGTTRGIGPLYQVTPTIGNPWVCNDAHILTLVHTMSDDVFDVPLQECIAGKRIARKLTRGGRLTHPISEFKQFTPENGVDFPMIPDPVIDPYFLGVWYGDGTKSLKGVQVTTADIVVVSMLHNMAEAYGLFVRTSSKEITYNLSRGRRAVPNNLLTSLRSVVGDGKLFPESCIRGSREVRKAFLAGLLDSDGHLGKGSYDIIQKRKEWSEGICFLARSLGFRATPPRPEPKSAYRNGVGGAIYWRVSLSGDFTGIPTRIERKQAKPRALIRRNRKTPLREREHDTVHKIYERTSRTHRRTHHVNRTGITVQSVGEGEYAGFELDGDGRFLLGDFTVTHNTTVALVAGKTIGSKRPLIVCPPHLLTSWGNEIAAVMPEADVRILSSIQDVESVARDTSDRVIISVLSRETAKLSHGWAGVDESCPKCGGVTPLAAEDLAKKRSRCEVRPLMGSGLLAQTAVVLARLVMPHDPKDEVVTNLLHGRWDSKAARHYSTKLETTPKEFSGLPIDYLDAVLVALRTMDLAESTTQTRRAIVWCLLAIDDQQQIEQMARHYLGQPNYSAEQFGRDLLLMLTPNGQRQTALKTEFDTDKFLYGSAWHWKNLEHNVASTVRGETHIKISDYALSWKDGTLTVKGHKGGSLEAVKAALKYITKCSNLKWGRECGEFLFHAIPEPRRVALAQHIQRRYSKVFDFLVIDEAHEYANENAAQTISANRLTGLGLPTIIMTGSVMNGYAESLFMNMWAVSRDFRKEFGRSDKQRFIDRYGYRKRLVTEKPDDTTGKVIAFGAQSDRVQRSERVIGNAPGVLPLFLLRHLLPISVTLHKADLALDLPPCIQERHLVEPTPELKRRFLQLQRCLVDQIRKDQFTENLAGKLFGQLAELPSYLDRSTQDTGNTKHGDYEIRYPESVGGDLVGGQEAFPSNTIMPKEQWMLDRVKQELAEGRNVMVFSWHVSLLPRLASMIEQAVGEKVQILYANKVPTAKRQDWITKQVVNKGTRVMVCNPVVIQTGLNNLIHFSTEIWMENPACSPVIYRQAGGRIDRIGQKLETRILSPVYAGTLQEQLHDLLMQKVAVSTATDGLDPESTLLASGVGPNDYLTGMSIGKQLWAMLSDGVYKRTAAVA